MTETITPTETPTQTASPSVAGGVNVEQSSQAQPTLESWKDSFKSSFTGSKLKEQKTTPQAVVTPQTTSADTKTEPQAVVEIAPAASESDEISVADLIGTKPQPKTTIDSLEKLSTIVEKEWGHKNVDTLLNSAKKWREDSKKLNETAKELGQFKDLFTEMPPAIKQALELYQKGQDFTSPFKSSDANINYNESFEKQDIIALAKVFTPDVNVSDVEGDDFVDITEDNTTTRLLKKSIKDNFIAKQQEIEQTRSTLTTQATENKTRFLNDVATSVNQLTSLPFVKPNALKAVEETMKSGDLRPVFVDEKGLLLPDAAKRLYFATNGEKLVGTYQKAISELQEQIALLISKGGDVIHTTKGADGSRAENDFTKSFKASLQNKRIQI